MVRGRIMRRTKEQKKKKNSKRKSGNNNTRAKSLTNIIKISTKKQIIKGMNDISRYYRWQSRKQKNEWKKEKCHLEEDDERRRRRRRRRTTEYNRRTFAGRISDGTLWNAEMLRAVFPSQNSQIKKRTFLRQTAGYVSFHFIIALDSSTPTSAFFLFNSFSFRISASYPRKNWKTWESPVLSYLTHIRLTSHVNPTV